MGQVNELKDFTRGQLDAALMKIGQDAGLSTREGIEEFLAGRLIVVKKTVRWTTDADGVIHFTLVSNGMTGEQWIAHLNGKSLPVGSYAQSVLRHKDFQPTKAGTIHKVSVLPGKLFSDNDRITKNIRAEAKKRKMSDPHAEVACLIRDNFTDKEIEEMGLYWIVDMHEPIKDSDGNPVVLGADRDGACRLLAYYAHPDLGWNREDGFAFSAA